MTEPTKIQDLRHAPDDMEWMCSQCGARTKDRHLVECGWSNRCFRYSELVHAGSNIAVTDFSEVMPRTAEAAQ